MKVILINRKTPLRGEVGEVALRVESESSGSEPNTNV